MSDVDDLASLVKRIRGDESQRAWAQRTGLGIGWVKMVESGETAVLTKSKFDLLMALDGVADADKSALRPFLKDEGRPAISRRLDALEERMDRFEAMIDRLLEARGLPTD